MRSIFSLLLALSCIAVADAAASAPTQTQATANVSVTGWRLECDPVKATLACRALDQIVSGNGSLVIGFAVNEGVSGKATLTMQVPLGAAVSKPIAVTFGDKSQSFDYVTCSQQGCFAIAPIEPAILDTMRKGSGTMTVSYTMLDQNLAGHAVTATISVAGFDQVYKKLQ